MPVLITDSSQGRSHVCVTLTGDWSGKGEELRRAPEPFAEAAMRLQVGGVQAFHFDTTTMTDWDSRIMVLVSSLSQSAEQAGVTVDWQGLPEGMQSLLRLSRAIAPRGERRNQKEKTDYLELIGTVTIEFVRSLGEANRFLGESLLSLWRFLRGKARYRKSDVAVFIELNGPKALAIVGIINVLLGVILAFMGAVQLRQFGAEIFVANLVALGQTREIAPMMTAIVMAGRTGAAYAAQLGTMQVNEEIDALKTFGFSPMDFLVLPRMLALAIMFPLLVLYSDALGMFGGYLVGVGMLGIGTMEYIEQTRQAIDLMDILIGVFKGGIFGIIVAVTGCMQGMQSGRSASAVGDATTRAVVTGIIAIIVTTAFFSVLTSLLGI